MLQASQLNLRPHRSFDETLLVPPGEQPQQQELDATQREPEEEPQEPLEQEQADAPIDGEEQRQDEEQPPMQDEDEEDEPELPLPVQAEADADVPDVPPPPPMPSMEEYQRRWQEKKAFHSRENNRATGAVNPSVLSCKACSWGNKPSIACSNTSAMTQVMARLSVLSVRR